MASDLERMITLDIIICQVENKKPFSTGFPLQELLLAPDAPTVAPEPAVGAHD
jgi:hypothetical protein